MAKHRARDDEHSALGDSKNSDGFVKRHRKAFIACTCILVLPIVLIAAYVLVLNSSLKNIDRISIDTSHDGRPADDSGENILLMGVDQGNKASDGTIEFNIAADSKRTVWPADKYHSDTMMIVHLSKDRRDISIVSIPRDSYVDVYDADGDKTGKNRVNEALTQFGPSAAVTTIERLVGLRIDHLAMVDFQSFEAITDALGGVTVHIPETVYYENSSSVAWQQGDLKLDGKAALAYVRERKNLPNSDYSRIRRQQNFLRAALAKLKSNGTLANPGRLKGALDAVTKNLAVDEGWSGSDIRGLAFSLRGASGSDIPFVTLPIDGYSQMIDGIGSVVKPDMAKVAELSAEIRSNRVDQFIEKYPKQGLEEKTKVR